MIKLIGLVISAFIVPLLAWLMLPTVMVMLPFALLLLPVAAVVVMLKAPRTDVVAVGAGLIAIENVAPANETHTSDGEVEAVHTGDTSRRAA